MPNISAMPQPSGVFQTRPVACGLTAALASVRGALRASSNHGSKAAVDSSAHMPSEILQSKWSATGTASSAGNIVQACSTVM